MRRVRSNRSIDTDVLSAGFARLLSAGHLQRYCFLLRADLRGQTPLFCSRMVIRRLASEARLNQRLQRTSAAQRSFAPRPPLIRGVVR